MSSRDTEKSFKSMVTLNQKQLQQHRQDQEKDQVQNEGHLSKINNNKFQKNFENLEKVNEIRKIDKETKEDINENEEEKGVEKYLRKIHENYDDEEEEEEEEEENVVGRNNESYCVDIEDYDESTQSSDVEEDLEEDDLRDRGWVSEIPKTPQTCEQSIGTVNGLALPTVEAPCFGDVCVKNSNNVHLGSKTFYKGPVTIKQFVYSNSEVKKDEELGDDEKRDSVPSQTLSQSSDVPLNQEYIKVKQWLITWRWAAIFCTMALMFVTVIVVVVLTSEKSQVHKVPIFPESPDSSTGGEVWTNDVRIVPRNDWLAQPSDQPLENLKLPVKYVFISHTATESCNKQSECTKRVRLIQTYHIESNKWSDIAYNFLVGGDGLAYEGRSWDYIGAHTFNYNDKSIGISFIGTFNDFVPNKSQLHAAQKLIEEGVKLGKISKDYILLGHRQVTKTLSPGEALFTIIKTWPHWSPTP